MRVAGWATFPCGAPALGQSTFRSWGNRTGGWTSLRGHSERSAALQVPLPLMPPFPHCLGWSCTACKASGSGEGVKHPLSPPLPPWDSGEQLGLSGPHPIDHIPGLHLLNRHLLPRPFLPPQHILHSVAGSSHWEYCSSHSSVGRGNPLFCSTKQEHLLLSWREV